MPVTPAFDAVDEDRATDQLCDEIFARLAALASLSPASVRFPSSTEMATVRERAGAIVAGIRASDGTARRHIAMLLFPAAEPEPTWWRTPLGTLLDGAPICTSRADGRASVPCAAPSAPSTDARRVAASRSA